MTETPPIITAEDYQMLVDTMFTGCDVKTIAAGLGITRASHYAMTRRGVRDERIAKDIRARAETAVTDLRARARRLDRFTTR